MNRRAAWVAALALPVIGVFPAWAVLFGISLRERSQAQSLIAAVNSMHVGTSTLEEVRPMVARSHAYALDPSIAKYHSADTIIYLVAGNQFMGRIGDRFYFLRYIGLSPWAVNAEIYSRNNRICELSVKLSLETQKVEGNRVGFMLSTQQSSNVGERFIISGGHLTSSSRYVFYRVKSITLPADATPAERAHAFGYNLSCVAKLGGCRDLSQILDLRAVRQDWDHRNPD
jgi:hypothetical protein